MRQYRTGQRGIAALAAAIGISCASADVASADNLLTTISSFNGSNGTNPIGDLSLAGSTLFGTTTGGTGATAGGSVYSVPITGGKATTLAGFNGSGASNPSGGVALSGSTLYGTTTAGGTGSNSGIVFSVSATGGSIKTLYNFQPVSGNAPDPNPVIVSGSTLYGTTFTGGANGGGNVYSIPVTGGSPTTLFSFTSANVDLGYNPAGKLILSGNTLYGTTKEGSDSASGNVFSIPITGGTPTTLASFNAANGSWPLGQVLIAGNTIYGTTSIGGNSSDGAIFSTPLTGGAITTLATFNGSNGAYPAAGMVIIGSTLYGTTPGTVFSVPVTGGAINTIATFNGPNGSSAGGTLVAFGTTLYGETSSGGVNGDGTDFALSTTQSANVTVTGGQKFNFAAYTGTTFVNTLSIASGATVVINPDPTPQTRQVVVVNSLAIFSVDQPNIFNGLIDVTNNDLDLTGITLASVTDQVEVGYAGGKWNSTTGIISSTAAADTSHLTALGVIQNNQSGSAIYTAAHQFDGTAPGAGDILVKYTYYGDANLDGQVDGSDYTLIDNGYNNHLTGWYNGDFNYDGKVDGSDYTLIDNAFNTQTRNLSDTAQFAGTTAQISGTSVPEPVCMLAATFGSLPLRRRRAVLK